MKTFEGVYANGHIRLKGNIKLAENLTVYVLVPDEESQKGIDPDGSRRIQDAKLSAGKRIREEDVASIRQDSSDWEHAGVSAPSSPHGEIDFGLDKTKYRDFVDHLFKELGITIQPIDAEQLQARMEHLGLKENELSRAVIEAREE